MAKMNSEGRGVVSGLVSALTMCLAGVRRVAAAWVILCMTIMMVAVWVQVGGRYVFNYSISWTGEVATISQIWMVLVGAGLAARANLHARVDILIAMAPLGARRVLSAATLVLGLWFLAAIVIGTEPMIRNGLFQTTPALQLPMWIPYLGLVVGPVYFAVEMVALTVKTWSAQSPDATDDPLHFNH